VGRRFFFSLLTVALSIGATAVAATPSHALGGFNPGCRVGPVVTRGSILHLPDDWQTAKLPDEGTLTFQTRVCWDANGTIGDVTPIGPACGDTYPYRATGSGTDTSGGKLGGYCNFALPVVLNTSTATLLDRQWWTMSAAGLLVWNSCGVVDNLATSCQSTTFTPTPDPPLPTGAQWNFQTLSSIPNCGGKIAPRLSVASSGGVPGGPRAVELFAIACDNKLYHNSADTNGENWWKTWSVIQGCFTGQPAAFSSATRTDAFVTGCDGNLHHVTTFINGHDNSATEHIIPNTPTCGDAPSVVSPKDGTFYLFAKACSGGLLTAISTDGGNTWGSPADLGGALGGNPVAVIDNTGYTDVFAVGTGLAANAVIEKRFSPQGGTGNFAYIGGCTNSDPAVAAPTQATFSDDASLYPIASGQVDLYINACPAWLTAGHELHAQVIGTQATNFVDIDTKAGSGDCFGRPAAVAFLYHVFARSCNGDMMHAPSYNGALWENYYKENWCGSGDPSATQWHEANGHDMVVAAVNCKGLVEVDHYYNAPGTSGAQSVGTGTLVMSKMLGLNPGTSTAPEIKKLTMWVRQQGTVVAQKSKKVLKDKKLAAGTYTASVDTLSGWTVSYSACAAPTNCAAGPLTRGNSVTFTLVKGQKENVYWHFTPPASNLQCIAGADRNSVPMSQWPTSSTLAGVLHVAPGQSIPSVPWDSTGTGLTSLASYWATSDGYTPMRMQPYPTGAFLPSGPTGGLGYNGPHAWGNLYKLAGDGPSFVTLVARGAGHAPAMCSYVIVGDSSL
jgi:hypothetical protein